jgi:hypothetical protein
VAHKGFGGPHSMPSVCRAKYLTFRGLTGLPELTAFWHTDILNHTH